MLNFKLSRKIPCLLLILAFISTNNAYALRVPHQTNTTEGKGRLKEVINGITGAELDVTKEIKVGYDPVILLKSLPISGRDILTAAKKLGKPVMACNIDNGRLSRLQIEPMMRAAIKQDAYILFEVGPEALKTYDDGTYRLSEYCTAVAYKIYKETGKRIVYGVHLDHNQISNKEYFAGEVGAKDQALKEALDRQQAALDAGFTSGAIDTSTLTITTKEDGSLYNSDDLNDENVALRRLTPVIITGSALLENLYLTAKERGTHAYHYRRSARILSRISCFTCRT
jgi:hypothetical protein